MTAIVIGLNSGQEIALSKVMLYPATLMAEATALRAQAASKMGHVSTGIGFLGSPGWAIAGSLLVGALESSVNKSNHQECVSLLQKAALKFGKAKDGGVLIEVHDIVNASQPVPAFWKAKFDHEKAIVFTGLSRYQIERLCDEFGFDKSSIFASGIFTDFKLLKESEIVNWSEEFVFSGEEFVTAEVDGDILHIKWSDVSTYKLVDTVLAGEGGMAIPIAQKP